MNDERSLASSQPRLAPAPARTHTRMTVAHSRATDALAAGSQQSRPRLAAFTQLDPLFPGGVGGGGVPVAGEDPKTYFERHNKGTAWTYVQTAEALTPGARKKIEKHAHLTVRTSALSGSSTASVVIPMAARSPPVCCCFAALGGDQHPYRLPRGGVRHLEQQLRLVHQLPHPSLLPYHRRGRRGRRRLRLRHRPGRRLHRAHRHPEVGPLLCKVRR